MTLQSRSASYKDGLGNEPGQVRWANENFKGGKERKQERKKEWQR